MATEHDFEELLKLSGLEPEVANRRASLLMRFFEITRFPFHPSVSSPIKLQNGKMVHLVEYKTGDNTNSVNNAENPTFEIARPVKLEEMGGTGLETASLRYTSEACEIGTRVFQDKWPGKFVKRLRNPTEHLDVLNEIWWLARFSNIEGHPQPARLREEEGKRDDIDWQFACTSPAFTINLEIKRRKNDIVRSVYGSPLKRMFEDVLPKFRRSLDTEINFLGITLFGNIDDDVKRAIDDFIRLDDLESLIDGVVVCSCFSQTDETIFRRFISPKAAILKSTIQAPDNEDLSQMSRIFRPMSIREAIDSPDDFLA